MLTRRRLLQSISAAPLVARAEKAPFKLLYSNDTTNILSCTSPFHKKGEPFRPEMLEATVDEAAGADVHMLQPGLGWVPWWQSKVYPPADHYRWWAGRTGLKPDAFGEFVMNGGDLVSVFVKRCRAKGQSPFVSLRMNDAHHLAYLDKPGRGTANISRFYEEHPQYRLGNNGSQRVFNWAIPEVRAQKFAFIEELLENYDLDGFELDFMRASTYFRQNETTSAQRAGIMTEFVSRVRRTVDRTARGGKRRWLCARVPCVLSTHDSLGLDLPALVAAGLDMIDLSVHYCTQQQTDLAQVRKLAPSAVLYLEMTHCTYKGPGTGGDSFPFVRTTDAQFYTAANLAYARGADGVSLLNFVYFREHGTAGRGPFNEPPFHILKGLRDPKFVARQPQWYVLSKVDNTPPADRPLPKKFTPGLTCTFSLDMTLAHSPQSLFRLRTVEDASVCRWSVAINGTRLAATGFVLKPIEHPYNAFLGEPNQFACFRSESPLIRPWRNDIAVTLESGNPVTLDYLDLALL